MYENYTEQNFLNSDGKKAQLVESWITERVHQYALKIDFIVYIEYICNVLIL